MCASSDRAVGIGGDVAARGSVGGSVAARVSGVAMSVSDPPPREDDAEGGRAECAVGSGNDAMLVDGLDN